MKTMKTIVARTRKAVGLDGMVAYENYATYENGRQVRGYGYILFSIHESAFLAIAGSDYENQNPIPNFLSISTCSELGGHPTTEFLEQHQVNFQADYDVQGISYYRGEIDPITKNRILIDVWNNPDEPERDSFDVIIRLIETIHPTK